MENRTGNKLTETLQFFKASSFEEPPLCHESMSSPQALAMLSLIAASTRPDYRGWVTPFRTCSTVQAI
eukprot:scaffold660733_cov66-Prasinocladus_malaysianus.AAC.1